ncbi:Co2+/Mg2+ efflux protein ApaG [Sphingomicrobium nitratireducens]|uniref:Co2+/Mg2+ efflux protein ApaG n=1 Tax=Sphingomicrobium nitratireducens TaxID=2964666 RepID=UPI002240462F|nr:Co2+/Mg2+ efflux protein ApaG [Sphingomicrobium nitratireducens]
MTEKSALGSMGKFFPNVATTGDITVRVSASYLEEQSAPEEGRWFWSYHVRIENDGEVAVQLLSREWRIEDSRGVVLEVSGEGVVGETPVIAPGGSYDYVSGCPLESDSGRMSGSYRLIVADGSMMDVAIPEFRLDPPED